MDDFMSDGESTGIESASATTEAGWRSGRPACSRRAPRRAAGGRVAFDFVIESSARRFAGGTAGARDLSSSGVFLERIALDRMLLPLEPFYVRVRFAEAPPHPLAGLAALGRLTRLESDSAGNPHGLGIRFDSMPRAFQRALEGFLQGHR
ncbi:MAG: PilZ domain-containing protein [Planctomycetes bacterium]|nr:PilZ domain-containing protein [Planctomycetota bacterium]